MLAVGMVRAVHADDGAASLAVTEDEPRDIFFGGLILHVSPKVAGKLLDIDRGRIDPMREE